MSSTRLRTQKPNNYNVPCGRVRYVSSFCRSYKLLTPRTLEDSEDVRRIIEKRSVHFKRWYPLKISLETIKKNGIRKKKY